MKLPPAPAPLRPASCGTIGPQGEPETTELPPMLPGATNGTIGPPSLDATYIGDQPHHDLPFVPVFLFVAFASSVAAWGFRLILLKKKAPLWVLGAVAGSIIMVAGLAWHLLESKPSKSIVFPAILAR